jgi:hypothetical protein
MATAFVNKHITRVLAAGGTVAEPAWASDVDAWISSQSLYGNLFDWSNPAFGVIKNGSNEISKIMGFGTTWLPRLGDLTPSAPASTTYDATAIGSKPAWTNAANTAYSYYGAARDGTIRVEPIRRKHAQGLTVVAVYKKNHANVSSMLGLGQFGGIYLQNTAGSPGSCKFAVGPIGGTTFTDTHGTTLANNAVHIIGGTFNGDQVISYVEGVAGSGSSTGYATTNSGANQYRPLLGGANLVNQFYYALVSGSSTSSYTLSSTSTTRAITSTANEAVMSISDLIIFDTALTPSQMSSLNTLLRTRYGA